MAYLSAIFAAAAGAVRAWRRRRERIRTRRIVEALPAGIRKDIGWATRGLDRLPDALGER
jgi:hypothetical protein